MSHSPHKSLPGYSPNQIWVDGCDECKFRAHNLDHGILSLDPATFSKAWSRAAQSVIGGIDDMSPLEAHLLSILWAVQVQLEGRGFRLGIVPTGPPF